jgi:hypothetical protein
MILMAVGAGWLAEAAGWADVPWRALLAGALVLVGAALMLGASSGPHRGLIIFGAILAGAVALSSAIEVIADAPLRGGIGEQTHRPDSVEAQYRWGIGTMTLDLRGAEPPLEGSSIEASTGIGELIVIIPRGVAVRIEARSGIGEVVVFGEQRGGLDARIEWSDEGYPRLDLRLDVAIGKVEVRR